MAKPLRVGVAAIARTTFDIEFATATAAAARQVIVDLGFMTTGTEDLLTDADAVVVAVQDLADAETDAIVVLQATFTDATLIEPLATLDGPLVLWAFPEVRSGGRLRLNSLCGINLAGYGLTRANRDYGWLYRDPADPEVGQELREALSHTIGPVASYAYPAPVPEANDAAWAGAVRDHLAGSTIGLIGDAPTGFEPSKFEADELAALTGVKVDRIELDELFATALAVPAERVREMGKAVSLRIKGVDELDPEPVEKSLRMHVALDGIFASRGWSGVAMRCWPETFNDYGAAACSALAFLSEHGVPACCERDVYGNLTALALQDLGDGPAFVADLVELDRETGTGTLWHCGLAPLGLADPGTPPGATIHSNRRKPLLNEFALKPGRVTLARISQTRGRHSLVIGGGEMLAEPLPFSGTAGVVKFDRPVDEVLATVMGEGLEHHYGIVYGDLRAELKALAHVWGIPVIDL